MATAQEFISVARSQVGYKESPANSNRTKYGAWYGMDGQPWCDMFVSWCAEQAHALGVVGKFAYTPNHAAWFKARGQWLDREEKPQPGDIVFFSNSSRICHVGIVTQRNGTVSVSTIEGNTSAGSNANGGQVQERVRTYGRKGSSWWIAGFGRPAWSAASSAPASHPGNSGTAVSTGSAAVKSVQRWLNTNYNAGLDVDGIKGPKTWKALVKAWQRWLNSTYGAGLAVDGIWGPRTRAATRVLKKGASGNGVKILQGALICLGYDTGGFDGVFGSKTDSAVRAFQRANGIAVDGQAGRDTFSKLFG